MTMLREDDGNDDGDEERIKQRDAAIREALDQKTGRLWSDPWDLEDMLTSKLTFKDLPEWAPEHVSRTSKERVQLYEQIRGGKKLPTLQELARLPLPPPPPPHPGMGLSKAYALRRRRAQYRHVLGQVEKLASTRIGPIREMEDWGDRQDAVDKLFEDIEFELKDKEPVLGKHPSFGRWVESAMEEYLRNVQKEEEDGGKEGQSETEEGSNDETALPIFIDCYGSDDTPDDAAPKILNPLSSETNPHKETVGRMVEEWELAAHDTTRRIMLRQSTRQIARLMQEGEDASSPKRICVSGRQGVGKTAALASIVAAARNSGSVVLYIPYGDMFSKNGYYIEPSEKHLGLYDLPVLSQQVCQQLLDSHGSDLEQFEADAATLEQHFTEDQMEQLQSEDGGGSKTMKVVDLLKLGTTKTSFAAMCYSTTIDVLMKQDQVPFVMVMDEFNCYYAPGHYFHMAYDEDVKNSIPYDQISLFKPALDAMAISVSTEEDEGVEEKADPVPVCMKRGAVVVATTESHAISRKVTDGLIANVKQQLQQQASSEGNVPSIHLIDVPRLSELEVEHMLANYEATGVGKLRLDRGETVMNKQEVAYLRMVSGGVAQKLMDACIM